MHTRNWYVVVATLPGPLPYTYQRAERCWTWTNRREADLFARNMRGRWNGCTFERLTVPQYVRDTATARTVATERVTF